MSLHWKPVEVNLSKRYQTCHSDSSEDDEDEAQPYASKCRNGSRFTRIDIIKSDIRNRTKDMKKRREARSKERSYERSKSKKRYDPYYKSCEKENYSQNIQKCTKTRNMDNVKPDKYQTEVRKSKTRKKAQIAQTISPRFQSIPQQNTLDTNPDNLIPFLTSLDSPSETPSHTHIEDHKVTKILESLKRLISPKTGSSPLLGRLWRGYSSTFTTLQSAYSDAKVSLVTSLIKNFKQVAQSRSEQANNVPEILREILKIQSDFENFVRNQNMISEIKKEFGQQKKEERALGVGWWGGEGVRGNKLDDVCDCSDGDDELEESIKPSLTSESSLKYDYQIQQTEAENLWKTHLDDDLGVQKAPLKPKIHHKNTSNPKIPESKHHKSIKVDDCTHSINFSTLKPEGGRNSQAFGFRKNDYFSQISHRIGDLQLPNRRKFNHRRSSSLKDKESKEVRFSIDGCSHRMTIDKSFNAHKSSDFSVTKRYLSSVDRDNKKKCFDLAKLHRETLEKARTEQEKTGRKRIKLYKLKISRKFRKSSTPKKVTSPEPGV
ncbi:unnamed protein product [Moneuplotes crassus]|uniref:Uncharacterized protein n=1 Tax=Euplotes crassus TaxID=5936 RepID=A0AAD1X9N2_EUPCR|nr:unnamed protein product [Moneuplotes crassus]